MRNLWKKILFSMWITGVLWVSSIWLVNAQSWWSSNFWDPENTNNEYSRDRKTDSEQNLAVAAGKANYKSNGLVPTIKKFINWVLGMLSLIALVICLRGWFQMLTASGDEGKYKKWFTILKQAAIALAVIGLSWLFVTLILYLINNAATTNAS